jgi:hypothetical protein
MSSDTSLQRLAISSGLFDDFSPLIIPYLLPLIGSKAKNLKQLVISCPNGGKEEMSGFLALCLNLEVLYLSIENFELLSEISLTRLRELKVMVRSTKGLDEFLQRHFTLQLAVISVLHWRNWMEEIPSGIGHGIDIKTMAAIPKLGTWDV